MKYLNTFLTKVDRLAPNPWYVDGVKQARPVTQLGMILGFIIGFSIYIIFFYTCAKI